VTVRMRDASRGHDASADALRRDELGGDGPMSEAQAHDLGVLSKAAFEPDAFKPHLTQAEAARRIAALSAKLRLLDEPPHTL
jgi:hypothetical protein